MRFLQMLRLLFLEFWWSVAFFRIYDKSIFRRKLSSLWIYFFLHFHGHFLYYVSVDIMHKNNPMSKLHQSAAICLILLNDSTQRHTTSAKIMQTYLLWCWYHARKMLKNKCVPVRALPTAEDWPFLVHNMLHCQKEIWIAFSFGKVGIRLGLGVCWQITQS